MNPYEKLLARKRTWTPVQCTDGPLTPGAEAAIRRALSMRHMELPVGDFVRDALEKKSLRRHAVSWNQTSRMRLNMTSP